MHVVWQIRSHHDWCQCQELVEKKQCLCLRFPFFLSRWPMALRRRKVGVSTTGDCRDTCEHSPWRRPSSKPTTFCSGRGIYTNASSLCSWQWPQTLPDFPTGPRHSCSSMSFGRPCLLGWKRRVSSLRRLPSRSNTSMCKTAYQRQLGGQRRIELCPGQTWASCRKRPGTRVC